MRIAVTGDSPAVPALRGNLVLAGCRVVPLTDSPTYRVEVTVSPRPYITVDIPDAIFGRLVTHAVASLSPGGGVFVQHTGGNRDDRAVVLRVPADQAYELAVERGVVAAVQDLWRHAVAPTAGGSTPLVQAVSEAVLEWRAWRDRRRWWQWWRWRAVA